MIELRVPNKRSLKIICIFLYIFLVTSLPDGIKSMTAIYKMDTWVFSLVYIYYYYFSVFEIPIIVLGLYLYRRSKIIRFMPIFYLILLINIFYCLFGRESVISLHSYEMFLLLATGFSASSIVLYYCRNVDELDTTIDYFVVLNFVLQLLYLILNKSIGEKTGAAGLPPGFLGLTGTMYLVWSLYMRLSKPRRWVQMVAFLTIFASGARIQLYAFAAIMIIYFSSSIGKSVVRLKWVRVFAHSFLSLVFIVGAIIYWHSSHGDLAMRYYNLFSGNFLDNVQYDSSYRGRWRSNSGGLEILSQNPMGLPFSIYALEKTSLDRFRMEYPHSFLLCYILLWSPPIALFCYGYLIWLAVKLFHIRKQNSGYIFVIYFLIMLTFYGAPVLYSKGYLFFFLIISYIKNAVLNNKFAENKGVFILEEDLDENYSILSPTVSYNSRKRQMVGEGLYGMDQHKKSTTFV
jgi:hypothetical protein